MLKKVKGLIVQDNEKKVKVLTSVFAGTGVDENIKVNIIKGLENFGFSKQEPGKKASPDFENYAAEITGNTDEEMKMLQTIIDSKKRHEVILSMINGKTAVIKTNSIPSDDSEKIKETEIIESKNEVSKYIGVATFNSENKNGLSIGLIFSSKNDDSEKISEFESMGMSKMQGKEEDQWVSYSMWMNKPSAEEIDIMKNFPTEDEGKFKKRGIITLDTSNYGSFRMINNILSIDDIPEKVNSSEAEENAMM